MKIQLSVEMKGRIFVFNHIKNKCAVQMFCCPVPLYIFTHIVSKRNVSYFIQNPSEKKNGKKEERQ